MEVGDREAWTSADIGLHLLPAYMRVQHPVDSFAQAERLVACEAQRSAALGMWSSCVPVSDFRRSVFEDIARQCVACPTPTRALRHASRITYPSVPHPPSPLTPQWSLRMHRCRAVPCALLAHHASCLTPPLSFDFVL